MAAVAAVFALAVALASVAADLGASADAAGRDVASRDSVLLQVGGAARRHLSGSAASDQSAGDTATEVVARGDGDLGGDAACAACIESFSASGGCFWVRSPAADRRQAPPPMPEQCSSVEPSCAGRMAAWCLQRNGQYCTTATDGDDCFGHVRWAMEVGFVQDPAHYAGLTQESSFEDFQMFIYLEGLDSDDMESTPRCPAPCPRIDLPCHNAQVGESCHGHVTWAREHGMRENRAAYPARLTNQSSFQEVQAWLHQIHHGGCPRPCA